MRLTALALLMLLIAGPASAEWVDIGGGFSADDDGSVRYPNGDIVHPDGSWTTVHEQLEDGRWVLRGSENNTEGGDGDGGPGGSTEPGHGSSDGGRGPDRAK